MCGVSFVNCTLNRGRGHKSIKKRFSNEWKRTLLAGKTVFFNKCLSYVCWRFFFLCSVFLCASYGSRQEKNKTRTARSCQHGNRFRSIIVNKKKKNGWPTKWERDGNFSLIKRNCEWNAAQLIGALMFVYFRTIYHSFYLLNHLPDN